MTADLLRRILSTGNGLVLVLLLCACGPGTGRVDPSPSPPASNTASPSPSRSTPSPQLIVGFKNNQPNLSQLPADASEPVGFEPSMVKAVLSDLLGRQVTFSPINVNSWEAQLDKGKIQVAVSTISYTLERNATHIFAGPYLQTSLGIMVGKDSPLTRADLDGLKNLNVCYVEKTTAADAVRKLLGPEGRGDKPFNAIPRQNSDDCLTAIRDHSDQVFLSDAVILLGRSIATPGRDLYRYIDYDPGSSPQLYGIALRPEDSALCLQIDHALDQYLGDERWFRSFSTWFGSAAGDRALTEHAYKPKQTITEWCSPKSSQQQRPGS